MIYPRHFIGRTYVNERSHPPEEAMQTRRHIVVFWASAVAWSLSAGAGDLARQDRLNVQMSPALQKLFVEEMRELLTGVRTVAAGLAVGDWKGIAATSARMQHSYVLEKKLTPTQEEDISQLPDGFRALDENFHLRANNLKRAAIAHDAEAATFQFSRLLEACITCHTRFAQTRFPAFGERVAHDHH